MLQRERTALKLMQQMLKSQEPFKKKINVLPKSIEIFKLLAQITFTQALLQEFKLLKLN